MTAEEWEHMARGTGDLETAVRVLADRCATLEALCDRARAERDAAKKMLDGFEGAVRVFGQALDRPSHHIVELAEKLEALPVW